VVQGSVDALSEQDDGVLGALGLLEEVPVSALERGEEDVSNFGFQVLAPDVGGPRALRSGVLS